MFPEYMPEDEYRGAFGLNWSRLKNMARSPRHYHFQLNKVHPPTPAMRLGSAVHAAILEPDRYKRDWVCYNGRRAGKAWADFQEQNKGKQILTRMEAMEVDYMASYCSLNPRCAARLEAEGWAERSVFWHQMVPGLDKPVQMKARLDWVYKDGDGYVLVDLKTTRDLSPREFGRQASKLGYHGQMAHYITGLRSVVGTDVPVRAEIMVVTGSGGSWDSGVYMLDETALECGFLRRRQYLERMAECQKANKWPGQLVEDAWLELPEWELAILDDADVVGPSDAEPIGIDEPVMRF